MYYCIYLRSAENERKCEAYRALYSLFSKSSINSIIQDLDSIIIVTFLSFCNCIFGVKPSKCCHYLGNLATVITLCVIY